MTIAIIGSGPTGIYTLKGLLRSSRPLSITIFEVEAEVGKGTPYHPAINDQAMLANIASIELPPIVESLTAWLRRQNDDELLRLDVRRNTISERSFYPRVVLGEYLHAQFQMLLARGAEKGFDIAVRARHRVTDIKLEERAIQLTVRTPDEPTKHYEFQHVVMATGHDWPETTEVRPGYFVSPWPAPVLKTIKAGAVGILGTSLSAIDALITVASAHGAFHLDSGGVLQYRIASGSKNFRATLMSRKGLLPEADFYCDYPYAPLTICTADAVDSLIAQGPAHLLDNVFELFKLELAAADTEYAAHIGLALLTVQTFAQAYFADREASDPFMWAAMNLAEAANNKVRQFTVPWRYAILRMHEVVGRAIPHLDEDDLKRFHKYFKSVFVDDYATVPHQSIERLLALKRAGRLEIMKLGTDYKISKEGQPRGVELRRGNKLIKFDAFIDATGQASLSVDDLPFPSLVEQGVIKLAATPEGYGLAPDTGGVPMARTKGIDLDDAFRPIFTQNLSNQLYCAAISYLLHKLPFVQGITSACAIGDLVSRSIVNDIEHGSLIGGSVVQPQTDMLSPASMDPGSITSQ